MKALSIRQPWAYAILHLGKPVENRTWHTRYRGPIYLHASGSLTRHEYMEFLLFYQQKIKGGLPVPPAAALPKGGIVGKAVIADCVSKHDSTWFFGPYGFVLTDVESMPFRKLRGELGLFEVPEEVAA